MQSLLELNAEYANLNSNNQRILSEYKVKLGEKKEEASSKTIEFSKFKLQTTLLAENSKSGKSIPVKFIDALEANEVRKDSEVVVVRLENIKLRNKLRREEQLLKRKV